MSHLSATERVVWILVWLLPSGLVATMLGSALRGMPSGRLRVSSRYGDRVIVRSEKPRTYWLVFCFIVAIHGVLLALLLAFAIAMLTS